MTFFHDLEKPVGKLRNHQVSPESVPFSCLGTEGRTLGSLAVNVKVNYCAKLSAPLHRHLLFVLVGSDLLTSVISNEDSGQRTETLVDTEGHTTTEIKALEEKRSSNRSNDRTIFENLPSGCR